MYADPTSKTRKIYLRMDEAGDKTIVLDACVTTLFVNHEKTIRDGTQWVNSTNNTSKIWLDYQMYRLCPINQTRSYDQNSNRNNSIGSYHLPRQLQTKSHVC